jgi:hypothetical protein
MSNQMKFVQAQPFTLAGAGCVIGDVTLILNSLAQINGTLLTMADFGTIGYMTIEPDNSTQEEQIIFTGIIQNANGTATLTGVSSVGFVSPYTLTSGVLKTHSGGVKLIITNTAKFYDDMASNANDEVITGAWSFTQSPTVPTPLSGSTTAAASVAYVNAIAIAGAPDASTTVKGIGRASVAPVTPTIPIFVTDNDTRVPTIAQTAALVGNNTDIAVGAGNKMVTQTGLQHNAEKYAPDTSGSSTAYVTTLAPAPISLTAGMIVYAKLILANTTTTPTINVNALGAKTIVKFTNTALVVGDISANMFCTLIYDGTNMVLQNPVGQTLSTSFVGTPYSSGNLTSTQNVDNTFTPNFTAKTITVYYALSGTNGGPTAFWTIGSATFNGTTLVANQQFVNNQTVATNFSATQFVINTTALVAGNNAGSGANSSCTLTITNITATQFTVHAVFTSPTANNTSGSFYVVANN